MASRIIQWSRLENKLPVSTGYPRVKLTSPALPLNLLLCVLVTPQRVNIQNGKGGILLRSDLNLDGVSVVMNQIVLVKNRLELLPPSFFVKSP
jgi:hypothetical protein